MLATSLKQRVIKDLQKGKFTKSKSTKSGGVRGFSNMTAGFAFTKLWDNYYLYFTCGNMVHRGMSQEEQDKKTMLMYQYLTNDPYYKEKLEIDSVRNGIGIKLKHDLG